MISKPDPSPSAASSAGQRYLGHVARLLVEIAEESPAIHRAAQAVADSIAGGGLLHVFGTGHSHMLAEEMFYRAGGLAAVNPILVEGLMLHTGARRSTRLERLPGFGDAVLADHPIRPGDTLIIASNSGGNAVCDEVAAAAREAGLTVIAIISLTHARSPEARASSRLSEVAHIIIDNHGVTGDAGIEVTGLDKPLGPTSTVAGAAIVNAIAAEAAEILTERGVPVEVFSSSNLVDGDATNEALTDQYQDRVRSL